MVTETPAQQLLTDEQTLTDLAVFSSGAKASVYGLFNRTRTQGGAALLEKLFREPLRDAEAINQRSAIFRFFSTQSFQFPVDGATVATLSHYLSNDDVRSQIQPGSQSLGQRFRDMVATDADVVFVQDGVLAAIRLLHSISSFLQALDQSGSLGAFAPHHKRFTTLLTGPAFRELFNYSHKSDPRIPLPVLAEIDRQIRFSQRTETQALLQETYLLDVQLAVGQVAREHGFNFGCAYPGDSGILRYRGLYHPHVEGAVTNDLDLGNHRVLFLTGANMAGKSTLMKSLGIALYLGHMGFPVAASELMFAVRDGIYTSINLADNLQGGASHYYAEVLRVKEVVLSLRAGNRLFVVFDELFRGTNVKDAHDATIALTRAFSRKTGSWFIISTHIMEAGEKLQQENLPVSYQFLPTELRGNQPHYTRVLRQGITADRQGMVIIQNEGILHMLEKGINEKIESTTI